MDSNDVLIDIGWTMERGDLESMLHVDRTRHNVIASAFHGKGPLRAVMKATLARDGIRCSSLEDERDLRDASKLVPYLRNAYIKTFEIDCSLIDAETIQRLIQLKGFFVIDNLELRNNGFFDLIDGALDCTTLSWESRNYKRGRRKLKQDYGYKDYEEDEIKQLEKRFAFIENFFQLQTVKNAENLCLDEIPYVHLKAVSRWLHGDDAPMPAIGAKELHVWWDKYEGREFNALISVLEQRFIGDTDSREYKLFASGETVGARRIQSQKLENNLGDVFEVETMSTCSSSITVTRYRRENAKRTSLMQNMDGPNVWEFHTVRGLKKFLLCNNVYELLARSRLIANEMICKCGSRMHLQIMRRWWDIDGALWRCSENCKNGYGETFHVVPTFNSWFYLVDKRCSAEFILKWMILHLGNGPDSEGATTRKKYRTDWRPQLDELLKHQDANIKDPLERFYAAVTQKYPYDGAYVLPVLEYWEY